MAVAVAMAVVADATVTEAFPRSQIALGEVGLLVTIEDEDTLAGRRYRDGHVGDERRFPHAAFLIRREDNRRFDTFHGMACYLMWLLRQASQRVCRNTFIDTLLRLR